MRAIRIPANRWRWLKVVAHLGAILPLIWIYYVAINDQLGGDPVEALLHFTGIGALHCLLLTLSISLLSKWLKFGQLMQLRQPLGLYSFSYAFCHVASFFLFELQLAWSLFFDEVIERPYLTVGIIAFIGLLLLAVTSPKFMHQRLGRNWTKIHGLIYILVILVGVHYLWSLKSAWYETIIYWMLIGWLLVARQAKIELWLKSFAKRRTKVKVS